MTAETDATDVNAITVMTTSIPPAEIGQEKATTAGTEEPQE